MEGGFSVRSNGMKAFEILRTVLNEVGWGSEPDEEHLCFHVDIGPSHAPVSHLVAAIAPDTQRFVFYVILGLTVPPERQDDFVRFITSLNWGLSIGNFEMDYGSGCVRFRSSLDFSGAELTETLIRNAILSAMNSVEAYAEALIDIISGKTIHMMPSTTIGPSSSSRSGSR
jgi:hypothetical protein